MFSSLKNAFSKFREKTSNVAKKFEERKLSAVLEDFEEELMINNVSYEIVEKILNDLKKKLEGKNLSKEKITSALKEILNSVLNVEQINILKLPEIKKPATILFVGVNGVGKTTSIAKITKKFLDNKNSVVLAASDTFRAAAIEQLEEHAKKLGVKIIKQDYGSDPAAVAFDAKKHAESKNIDVVLIDTAGRQHASEDLMNELRKISMVIQPDLKILVVDSLTGNDASEQAKYFNQKIGIDGIIVSKADADEKGGAIISAAYETKKPILFLGTGQNYEDLKAFDKDEIIKKILD